VVLRYVSVAFTIAGICVVKTRFCCATKAHPCETAAGSSRSTFPAGERRVVERNLSTAFRISDVAYVTDTQWRALPAAAFLHAKVIVFGEGPQRLFRPQPNTPFPAAALDTMDVWGPAVLGRIVAIAPDPLYHRRYKAFIAAIDAAYRHPGLGASLVVHYGNWDPTTMTWLNELFGARPGNHTGSFQVAMSTVAYKYAHDAAIVRRIVPPFIDVNWELLRRTRDPYFFYFTSWPSYMTPVVIENRYTPRIITDETDVIFGRTINGAPMVLVGSAPGPRSIPVVLAMYECGNGIVEGDEECDDNNNISNDNCSALCTIERCGNAMLDAGEECDDGNAVDGDGCSSCTIDAGFDYATLLSVCGNNVTEAGEECDDGNLNDNDACDASCHLTSVDECGDVPAPCSSHANCSDPDFGTRGGVVCTCKAGFTGDGLSCLLDPSIVEDGYPVAPHDNRIRFKVDFGVAVPSVLAHVASSEQLSIPSAHSSMSSHAVTPSPA